MLRLAGFVAVLAAGYAAYRYLFGHGWLGTSACIFIWFLLASLYKPKPRGIPMGLPDLTEEERKILFTKRPPNDNG